MKFKQQPFFFVLYALALISASAQTVALDTLRQTIEDARLSLAVYDLSTIEIPGGWRQLPNPQRDSGGFQAAAYERRLSDGRREIVVAFAGTHNGENVWTDIRQGMPLSTGIYDKVTERQFEQARSFAAGYFQLAEKDKSISEVHLVGHSLGGALVQYAGASLGMKGTIFNSSALLKMAVNLTPAQKDRANHLITQFHLEGDPVHEPTRAVPGAIHLGADYLVKPAPDMTAKTLTGAFAVNHSMEGMILSLENARVQTANPRTAPHEQLSVSRFSAEPLSHRIALTREVADRVVRQTNLVVDAFKAMERYPKVTDRLERITSIYDWASAIDHDVAEFKGKPFVLVRSELIWKAAEVGWDKALERIYRQSGIVDAKPDFGAFEALRAGLEVAHTGRWDVKSVEHFWDGMVGLTWGSLGYLESGGNARVAELYQQTAQNLGRYLRSETYELFRDMTVKNAGVADKLIQMYGSHIDRMKYDGRDLPSFDQWLAGMKSDGTYNTVGSQVADLKQKSGFTQHYAEQAARILQNSSSITIQPIKAVNVAPSGQNIRETLQNQEIAVSLARPENKVLIVGVGPLADKTAGDMARKIGNDKVVRIPSRLNSYETYWAAADAKADTIINVSQTQEHYREITTNGYRQTTNLSKAPGLPEPLDRSQKKPLQQNNYPFDDRGGRPPPSPAAPDANLSQRNNAAPGFSRFETSLPRVGGVMLQGAAEMDAGNALSVGTFSLIFQGSEGAVDIATLRRFVTTLWSTYFTAKGPGISIDPIGAFSNRHAVRYIGRVVNSDLGRVMRETDYKMKEWAVGSGRPDLPDWLTPEEIGIRNGSVHFAASRFWFVPENMRFRQAGDSLLFEEGTIRLKTEYLFQNRGDRSPENEEWADTFTRRYGEIANRYPVFGELYEYAKLASLTKYLSQRRIPLLWFLLANREMVMTEDSPGTVKAFARKSDYFEEVQIAGGVDLSPSVRPDSFVFDEELLNALADVRRTSPKADDSKTEARPVTTDVVRRGEEILSVTPSQTVVISESRGTGDSFATDLGLRVNEGPHLELARYRRSEFPQVHTFGRDWHVMIPYSIRPASSKRRNLQAWRVPESMILTNLLTGQEEVLSFDATRYEIAGYVPEHADANLNIGIFFLNNRTFRMADKLGCEFQFDESGRLTEMLLAPNYRIEYKYGRKTLGWRDFDIPPFRIEPDGRDRALVDGLNIPSRMRLFDAATGEEEVFVSTVAPTGEGGIGYTPIEPKRSAYAFLAFNRDGSLELTHKSSGQIAFDRAGRFTSQTLDTLEKIVQDPYEVRFEYAVSRGQFRIVTARIFERDSNSAKYAVIYRYSRDGVLSGSSVVTAEKASPPQKTVTIGPHNNSQFVTQHNP